MSAVALYDILARGTRSAASAGLAAALVRDLVADLARLRVYEQFFGPPAGADASRMDEWDRTVWDLYHDWSNEAAKLLDRVRQPDSALPNLAELEDGYGRTMARLSVTPAQTARARRDARAGNTLPIQALRDELRARRRA